MTLCAQDKSDFKSKSDSEELDSLDYEDVSGVP